MQQVAIVEVKHQGRGRWRSCSAGGGPEEGAWMEGHPSMTEADPPWRSPQVMFSLASLEGDGFRNCVPVRVDNQLMRLA